MLNPQFTITNDILSYISQIEAAKQIIENAPMVPAWERKFQHAAEVRTIHYSTKIEGNKLELDDAEKILDGKDVKSIRQRDIREISNYREVVEYIGTLKDRTIDENFILDIHGRIMDGLLPEEETGAYRTCEEALIDSRTNEVVFEPVKPEYISAEMNTLLEWYQNESDTVHPVLKAGILCYEIARIHPFTDGSGRTSRIVATYSLYSDGYDIKRFFSLEEYYDQNLDAYYQALESVEDNADDLTEWLEFFTKGLAVELERIKKKVLDLSRDVKLRQDIGQVALNERQIELINFMQEHGRVRNKDWQGMFPDVSDDTILRDLKDLKKKGIVQKRGRTKAARYELK